MEKFPFVSIIVPTLNERQNIKILCGRLSNSLKEKEPEIIVVDDNSSDRTWQEVLKIKKENKQVHLLRRIQKKGLVSAINEGIAKSRGQLIGWLDADLSHPPEYFKKMLTYFRAQARKEDTLAFRPGEIHFPKYDVVIGSRYASGGADKRQDKTAVLASFIINKLANLLIDSSINDYTSGFILAKREVFQKIKLSGDYGEYFIQMLVDFKKNNFRIKELPYISIDRRYGESKTYQSLVDFFLKGIKYIRLILKIFLHKNDSGQSAKNK